MESFYLAPEPIFLFFRFRFDFHYIFHFAQKRYRKFTFFRQNDELQTRFQNSNMAARSDLMEHYGARFRQRLFKKNPIEKIYFIFRVRDDLRKKFKNTYFKVFVTVTL